jgi:hypothetical protein
MRLDQSYILLLQTNSYGTSTSLKETGQALIILMRTSKSTYNPLNEGAVASSSSPCPIVLLK